MKEAVCKANRGVITTASYAPYCHRKGIVLAANCSSSRRLLRGCYDTLDDTICWCGTVTVTARCVMRLSL